MKEKRGITCGHKTFGVQWLFEHPATHQGLVTVDSNAARSPKRFIPQNRYSQCKSTKLRKANKYKKHPKYIDTKL